MLSHLSDLSKHMSWADSIVWSAIMKLDKQKDIYELHNLMLHLHSVQHVYFRIWHNESYDDLQKIKFETLPELSKWGMDFHKKNIEFINNIEEQNLYETVNLPWTEFLEEKIGRPPENSNLLETIYQVIIHTSHHRGQVNTKIRQLGGEPPLNDYIYWVWLGKPNPWIDKT